MLMKMKTSLLLIFFAIGCQGSDSDQNETKNINSSISINQPGLVHIASMIIEDHFSLIGLDKEGLQISANIFDSQRPKVLSYVHIPDADVLVIEMHPEGNYEYVTTSGQTIAKDCKFLVLFYLSAKTSECFSRNNSDSPNYSYKVLNTVDKEKRIISIRNLFIEATGEYLVQLVARISPSSFHVLTETVSLSPFSFVVQSKLGMLTASNDTATGEKEWNAFSGTGREFTKVKLDFKRYLGEKDGCFFYIKQSNGNFAVFCPYSGVTSDSSSASLDSAFPPTSRIVALDSFLMDSTILVNDQGRLLLLEKNKICCTKSVLPISSTILSALVEGSKIIVIDSELGLVVFDTVNNSKVRLISTLKITAVSLNKEKTKIVYIGKTPTGEQISGSIDFNGAEGFSRIWDE